MISPRAASRTSIARRYRAPRLERTPNTLRDFIGITAGRESPVCGGRSSAETDPGPTGENDLWTFVDVATIAIAPVDRNCSRRRSDQATRAFASHRASGEVDPLRRKLDPPLQLGDRGPNEIVEPLGSNRGDSSGFVQHQRPLCVTDDLILTCRCRLLQGVNGATCW